MPDPRQQDHSLGEGGLTFGVYLSNRPHFLLGLPA